MCTQWLPTVCTSGARHQMSALGSPQVNKFEQISVLGHQLSLAGVGRPCTERVSSTGGRALCGQND